MAERGKARTMAESTVFLVEDDRAVGEALCDLLDSANIRARYFQSAEEFLAAWTEQMPGCLVLDVRLPGMSGMELQTRLREAGLNLPVIVMTAHGDIPMVRKALKAGAVEFLTKPFQDEELLQAIEQAFALDQTVRQQKMEIEETARRVASLTERERQVVELVTEGLTNREAADRLFLSVVTVKLYRRLAMGKLGVSTFAELVKLWQKA